jgi:hypothetical protein
LEKKLAIFTQNTAENIIITLVFKKKFFGGHKMGKNSKNDRNIDLWNQFLELVPAKSLQIFTH